MVEVHSLNLIHRRRQPCAITHVVMSLVVIQPPISRGRPRRGRRRRSGTNRTAPQSIKTAAANAFVHARLDQKPADASALRRPKHNFRRKGQQSEKRGGFESRGRPRFPSPVFRPTITPLDHPSKRPCQFHHNPRLVLGWRMNRAQRSTDHGLHHARRQAGSPLGSGTY